jgi:predicted branched-subunit amino acid permease
MAAGDVRAGAAAVAPMLLGVVPFGLVAGATSVSDHFGTAAAVGMSTIVFAGASQLAALQALAGGGSAIVAVIAACTINLRLLLYSASLAPYLAQERTSRRLLVAYLLTDQAYAVSIARWSADPDGDPHRRMPYYLGAALTLWVSWQLATLAGALGGAVIPRSVPLDFTIPLVFLVLLVPAINSRPAAVAAAAGGAAAVVAAELGSGSLSILAGAAVGIAAGALAEGRQA